MKQPSEMEWLLAVGKQKMSPDEKLQAQRAICRIAQAEARLETLRRLVERLIDQRAEEARR